MVRLSLCFVLLSLHAAAAANPVPAAPFPAEFWVSQTDGWAVETAACGSELCGYLVNFKLNPDDPPGYQPVDTRNPDRAKRCDRICDHIVMGGFHPSKAPNVTWEGGWVYDPISGATYSGKITLVDKDTVKLRGYLGIPLLGRTLVLHRQATPPPRLCDDPSLKPVRIAE